MSATVKVREHWAFWEDGRSACTKTLPDGSLLSHHEYAPGKCPVSWMTGDVAAVSLQETMSREEFERRWPKEVDGRSVEERAYRSGLVDCGVSLRTGWLTEKGRALL